MKDLNLGNDKHLKLNVKPIRLVSAQLAFQLFISAAQQCKVNT